MIWSVLKRTEKKKNNQNTKDYFKSWIYQISEIPM